MPFSEPFFQETDPV